MLFNSLTFMTFLGVIVVLYYLIPHRLRWILLLLGSYYFYMSWKPTAAIYLVAATLVAYFCGLGISRTKSGSSARKTFLLVGVLVNLGMLCIFKYFDFLSIELESLLKNYNLIPEVFAFPQLNFLMPVGLSFFTFSVVSYLFDVYRGKMDSEEHIGRFGVYVAFFPKIFAGPIERAQTFLPQLKKHVRFDPKNITPGLQLILWGLFKKVVIADRLAPFVTQAFSRPAYSPPLELIIGVYFFAFQLYCDFSGYTDIARGIAKLLGFDLMENFKRSYLSKSTSEFWAKRWHISLATWFRDYLYIPMGGSRVSWPRHYINLMATFVVSGLWHAGMGYGVSWSFMVWGALNGFYQWVSVATAPLRQKLGSIFPKAGDNPFLNVIRVLFTFHLITFAWIFFRANTTSDAFTIIKRIYNSLGMLPKLLKIYPFTSELLISFALIATLIFVEILDERKSIWERIRTKPAFVRWAVYFALIFSLLILGKWGLAEFIYMSF